MVESLNAPSSEFSASEIDIIPNISNDPDSALEAHPLTYEQIMELPDVKSAKTLSEQDELIMGYFKGSNGTGYRSDNVVFLSEREAKIERYNARAVRVIERLRARATRRRQKYVMALDQMKNKGILVFTGH